MCAYVVLFLRAQHTISFCAGYKTGAITNNWIDDTLSQSDRQLGSSLLGRDLFDVVLESCKVGLRKPDFRLYQMACERLGVEPNEVPQSYATPLLSIMGKQKLYRIDT